MFYFGTGIYACVLLIISGFLAKKNIKIRDITLLFFYWCFFLFG